LKPHERWQTAQNAHHKKAQVVALLRRSGNLAEATRLAGVGRRPLYAWQAYAPAFVAACHEARDDYRDAMEAVAG
jgi:hypothetical protein